MLKEDGLEVNKSKTEEFSKSTDGDDKWSLIDTESDIKRRHGLATSSFNKLEKAFKSRTLLRLRFECLMHM